jgi:aspartyl-tRNA(Asn)/glutamyl-tRNA(Gln) amidotransferase subunit A
MIPTYQILSNAEASSNLSRYDGILFGYRSPEAQDLSDTILKSRTEGFGTEVKRRIMLGTFVLSEGYYDAYYNKAQKLRNLVKQGIDDLLAENDFLVLPATPSTAFSFGDKENLTAMYNEDIFTIPASLGGFPAITVPVGTHSNGLPYSIQLIGRHFEEDRLLAFTEKLVQTAG